MTISEQPLRYSAADELRADRRFRTGLPVLVNTVMDDQQGWIVDVSRCGIKLSGIKAPPRSRVFVHYKGQFAGGTVRWWKPGQSFVGVVLDAPLRTGPLAEVWRRFHNNVESFGKHRAARPTFGRKLP